MSVSVSDQVSVDQPSNSNLAAPESLPVQDFLVQAATLLHRYGTPAFRLERVMKGLAHRLGIEADFLYTPTSLLVSFKEGFHRTRLERIEPSGVELGKLIDLDSTLDEVAAQEISSDEALRRIQQIDKSPSRYGFNSLLVANFIAAASVAILLGGRIPESVFSGTFASIVMLWDRMLQRWFPQEHLLEITAGFFSAVASIAVGQWMHSIGVPFDQGTACLGSLIVLIPGFTFTVAVAELANRHLSCGVARLAGSAVVFLALTCGVALAWRLGAHWRLPVPDNAQSVPDWLYLVFVLIAPLSLAVLFQARARDFAIIVVTAWIGILTTMLATGWQGQEFGAFAGALALGAVANLYARIWDRPAMVAQMPAILMLVPGSLGYRSLTAFVEKQDAVGLETAFAMVMIAISIVGGLLASNLVVPPKRIL